MRGELTGLIDLIRLNFHALKKLAESLHGDLSLTASMRAVLELLENHGPQTVPGMARSRGVSRQHIQMIVNDLIDQGLVEEVSNPHHKSSPLIRSTPEGQRAYAGVKKREAREVEALGRHFHSGDVRRAAEVLERLLECVRRSSP